MKDQNLHKRAKRAIDLGVAFGAIVVGLVPAMGAAFTMAVVNRTINPIFLQERVGLNGDRFRIIKFKTMSDAKGPDGTPLPDAERTTKLGEWLRRSKFDEYPQVINVLRGEMSIVGPRPVATYSPLAADKKRHSVLPGLTCLAQLFNTNTLGPSQMLALDHHYVDHPSIRSDLSIMAKTIPAVFMTFNAPHSLDPRVESAQKLHM